MQYKEILDDYIAHGNKNLSAEDEKAKVDAIYARTIWCWTR